ncbi:MAG: DUF1727 domain-containing protein [Ruminococcaceae bacterium]|nr:DUF1727 domain-containing protein [Oscillospiraceae bacterium]
MKYIRLVLAVIVSKILYMACRLLGSRASTAPGKYARMICPDIIKLLSKKVRKQIIVVCGTNGKTTTNNLINTALTRAGYKTVCNNVGANMLNGIAAAFCKDAGFFGAFNVDYACLEVDEANMPLLFKELEPSLIVVTNLFRDQLDRYGEADSTAKILQTAIDMAPKAKLILNADDSVTSVFGEGRDAVYYGAASDVDLVKCEEIRDGNVCPKCGYALEYEYYLYSQIGKYNCAQCGYKNPKATHMASDIKLIDGVLNFDILSDGLISHAESEIAGLYNVYNLMMAYSALDTLGIDKKFILSVLCSQKPEPGRMSRFNIGGKIMYLILSKNPAGFNQSVAVSVNDTRKKAVLLALNDAPSDGEDISWIWDVDFETLLKSDNTQYIVTGKRRYDMYLRLKYASCDEKHLCLYDTIEEAIDKLIKCDVEVGYLLVNYTAMYPAYLALKALEEGDSADE